MPVKNLDGFSQTFCSAKYRASAEKQVRNFVSLGEKIKVTQEPVEYSMATPHHLVSLKVLYIYILGHVCHGYD